MPRVSGEDSIHIDVLIFGGGVAGLWLLDELRRRGYAALLLESARLGDGQTAASQGIIHGGLKYTLQGLFTPSADAIRDMPPLWRDCLAGRRTPDLRAVEVRSDHCHLWRTTSLGSRIGMLGAKALLRVPPEPLERAAWPEALAGVSGEVYRLGEPVIDPLSLVRALVEMNAASLLRYDRAQGPDFDLAADGAVRTVAVASPAGAALTIAPRMLVLTAGAGNAALLERLGEPAARMQRRPLHMVMARGALPELNGHCTDFARTRVTITSATDRAGRRVWQIGGQIAEDGVAMSEDQLLAHARREVAAVLPGVDLGRVEWAAYRIDRAEAGTAEGKRPDDVAFGQRSNVLYGWPTKLALAPRLAEKLAERIEAGIPAQGGAGIPPARSSVGPPRPTAERREETGQRPVPHEEKVGQRPVPHEEVLHDWPRPEVALPPWEKEAAWRRVS